MPSAPLIKQVVKGDRLGDDLYTGGAAINAQVPWGTTTYNAGALISAALPAGTRAQNAAVVNAAIPFAKALGYTVCHVPAVLIPFDPNLVAFDNAMKMTCEGANPAEYDVRAYGADWTGSTDSGPALAAVFVAAGQNVTGVPKIVRAPAGLYITNQQVTIPAFV